MYCADSHNYIAHNCLAAMVNPFIALQIATHKFHWHCHMPPLPPSLFTMQHIMHAQPSQAVERQAELKQHQRERRKIGRSAKALLTKKRGPVYWRGRRIK